ncbi:HTH-type transcriptional repressor PurR [Cellulomonas sp. T2.31MG-18]|uniref:LacI family DNA-binding transcriptional regulator n=1 Tax=Cellulomonas sp. T2.31MG-18 TaxID=3157619 RepID=UPI0035E7BBAD
MSKRPTVYDVARLAGVSTATVSFTYSKPERVRPDTRAQVLAAADQIGYVPRASARDLARGRTGALGLHAFDFLLETPGGGRTPSLGPDLVTPDASGVARIAWEDGYDDRMSDPRAFPLYVDEVQRGFELECWRAGRALLLSSGTDPRIDLTESAGRVDGLAVFPGDVSLAALEQVARRIPIVLLSRHDEGLPCNRVLVDNASGMRQVLEHLLVEHRTRSIGYVGSLAVADFAERFEALRSGAERAGIAAPVVLDDSDASDGRPLSMLIDLASTGRLPEALVCGSDQVALQALDTLAELGVDVPGDVLVTGFDGVLAGRLSNPTLTTVRQPMEAMGRLAARLLVDHSADAPFATYRLEPRLLPRGSCGCGAPARALRRD